MVSPDKRWIVTADHGNDSTLVVWDSVKAVAVKSIPQPHPLGVETLDISHNGNFIVTISKGKYFAEVIFKVHLNT